MSIRSSAGPTRPPASRTGAFRSSTARSAAALGDTSATLIGQVAQGLSGSPDATVTLLTHLTSINLQLSGPITPTAGDYSDIVLVIGGEIATLVNEGALSTSQALGDVLAVPGLGSAAGVADNAKAVLLAGFAAAGNAAQQVAAGQSLAALIDAGGQPDLSLTLSPALISPAVATLVLAGMVVSGSASTRTAAGAEFAQLVQSFDALQPGTLTSVLDSAVASGALSAAAAVDTLAIVAAGAFINLHTVFTGDQVRSAVAGELVNLVTSGQISADNAVAALAAQAGAGSLRLQAESGRLIAALQSAGATPSELVTDIEAAVTAQTLTLAQGTVIETAAALTGPAALAAAVGSDIGAMIAAGRVTVANALADIQAADGAYGVGDGTHEVILLNAAAGATTPGLQLAVGEAIGALLNRGVVGVDATIAAINSAVGDFTATQGASVLIGVAQAAGLQAQVAVGGEFDALIAANQLAMSDVIGDLDQAIRASNLSATAGFAVLLSLASNSAAMVVPVTNELAALIGGSVVTPDQALSALFAGAGAQDFAFMPPSTDGTLAAIVTALVAQNAVTVTQVVTDLNAAASGTPIISSKHAVGVLLDLAADTTDPAAAQAYATELSSLVAGGLGAAALANNLLADVAAGTMSPDQAVAILASTVGSAPAGQAASLQALIGATLATLVGNGSLTVARLVTDLQTAVSNGTLGVDGEVGLIAELASSPSSAVNGSALPGELIRLIKSGTPAAQVFGDIEAAATAAGVSYDQGFGLLIAEIATTTDATLQTCGRQVEIREPHLAQHYHPNSRRRRMSPRRCRAGFRRTRRSCCCQRGFHRCSSPVRVSPLSSTTAISRSLQR